MSEEIAISLQNVSKCFKRYAHPVDRLKELLLPQKTYAQEFWALRDINLEVPRGHSLGIVGRNGSGKSTLLQIVVGTLTTTSGEARVNGRISALLELGSGFNPEFTGRQNVFLNGRLLGLEQQQIEAKFDDIAAFADIGDFIEQPVKTYSSGMFVRLAFAVAINVEPDILVVDEALAVGDEAFQRKCFSRIQAIQDSGGTILFVSHSASHVIELCDYAVLLDRGDLLLYGSPKSVITNYHKLIYAPADKIESLREEIKNTNSTNLENSQHKD
ncbi:MAG: ABC transporter ATP-binding protein, partial [Cyanobacteria bacterium J06635_10]